MNNKITIHRALTELKVIDDKISRAIKNVKPTAMKQKDTLIDINIGEAAFNAQARSSIQAVDALIERKFKIKSAIVLANALTQITICGRQMSIAHAISYRSIITMKKNVAARLKTESKATMKKINANNDIIQQNADSLSSDSASQEGVAKRAADIVSVGALYKKENQFSLVDPLNVEELIESTVCEVEEFEAEIDATLSEINSITEITI